MVTPVIAGFGSAFPPPFDQQEIWTQFFADYYQGHPIAERVWQSSGVATRHGVCDPRVENVSQWTTTQRMQRYLQEAMPLGKDAVCSALAEAHLAASDVGLFVVASCTGYATPGLDILLARDVGMSVDVRRVCVGHMGCYAAVPALAVAADHVRAHGTPAVVLCAELTSLHVQPATDEVQQMVAHALFSDGVGAIVVAPDAHGWEVVDVASRTDVEASPLMTWDVTDLGFRMGLSPQVPDVLGKHVRPAMDALLTRHGLTVDDVTGWAVHPGGPRIVDVVEEELALRASAVDSARKVLRDHGNCSSATVLFVLDEMARQRPAEPDDHAVAMAFGPGLTLYAALLRWT
jgi:alkylresorcinol/alkylpyrone synthase